MIALKVGGWPKILVPALLGQALGIFLGENFSLVHLLLPLGFTLGGLLYILLLNDWSDARVDLIKRRMFPQSCLAKTLPDGIFSSRTVVAMGLLSLAGAVICAALLSVPFARGWFLGGALAGVMLFQAYSFFPLKLNYRGGGELLEMLGVGLLLPWLHAYGQSGLLWHPMYGLFFGLLPLSFASALADGLADEESDLVGGKRTFTTLLGNTAVRRWIARFFVAGCVVWLAGAFYLRSFFLWWLMLIPVGCLVYYFYRLSLISPAATTREFSAHRVYKGYLHRGIWLSTTLLALALLIITKV
jgi:1,4-dihydroxy-2-naphthoate octaprenyltransferase/chlorophyll synthase